MNRTSTLLLVAVLLVNALGVLPVNATTRAELPMARNPDKAGPLQETALPTPETLLTPTTSPTVEITPAVEDTVTPEINPTPAIEITPTPTEAPTLVEQPTELPSGASEEEISAGLSLDKMAVRLYEPFQVNWDFPADRLAGSTWALKIQFPEGVFAGPIETSKEAVWTENSTLSLDQNAGGLSLYANEKAPNPFILTVELTFNGKPIQQASFSIDLYTRIDPAGGLAVGQNGRVSVAFPEKALQAPVDVLIRSTGEDEPSIPSLSGRAVEITAQSADLAEAVRKFDIPLEVIFQYDPEEYGEAQSALSVFYYDPDQATWIPLPSQVDTQAATVTAQTDHFTAFDIQPQAWEGARTPSMANFQTAAFTGAATYSYPLQLPPGPGGLAPSLSLSYNSQVVDGAGSRTQASWVGMGWTLDTGYIQRNMHGTPDLYGMGSFSQGHNDRDYRDNEFNVGSDGDDTFSLVLNGQSWTLVRLKDTDNDLETIDFRTAEESFYKIRRYHQHALDGYYVDVSYWVVWDKTGNQYQFSEHARWPDFPNGCGAPFMQTWAWPLTVIRNAFGQEIHYTYEFENDAKRTAVENCYGFDAYMQVAYYPREIRYPHNRYRVLFNRQANERSDWDSAWDDMQARMLWQKSMLDEIRVEADLDGDGTFESLIRKYAFDYEDTHLFTSMTWPRGGKTPALMEIKEYGSNETSSLPSSTFTYGDGMHLTQASNGSGGQIHFTYDSTPWFEINDNRDLTDIHGATYSEGDNIFHYAGDALSLHNPGQYYKIEANIHAGHWNVYDFIFGIDDGHRQTQAAQISITDNGTGGKILTSVVYVPADAGQLRFYYICEWACDYILYTYKVKPLLTRYRVAEKMLSDATTGKDHVYSYRYDGAATNDPVLSTAAGGTNPYDKPYTQFRGHSSVTETGPEELVTTSGFSQADGVVGSLHSTLTSEETFADSFDGLDSGAWSYYPAEGDYQAKRIDGDPALTITHGPDWGGVLYRNQNSLEDGEMLQMQFRLSGANAYFVAGIEALGSPYRRWMMYVKPDNSLVMLLGAGAGDTEYPIPLYDAEGNFRLVEENRWYHLTLGVSGQTLFARVWLEGDPGTVGRKEIDTPASMQGQTWRYAQWIYDGTVWLDEYREGSLAGLQSTLYANDSLYAGSILPLKNESGTEYTGAAIYWPHAFLTKSMNFEGTKWMGTASYLRYETGYQGGAQYGNVTQVVESAWNGSAFVDKRLIETRYFPAASGVINLTGLPGYTNTFSCPSGSTNGACYAQITALRTIPPTYACEYLLSSHLNLYDNNTAYNQPPTTGILKGQRDLLYFADTNYTDNRYQDEFYAYDAWGNQTSLTRYSGEGTWSQWASVTAPLTAQTTSTVYDPSYHTYPVSITNALSHLATTIEYDYLLGVPTSEQDANGQTTYARYDVFGRITRVARPLDNIDTGPTIEITYHEYATPNPNPNPYWTEVSQRIDELNSYRVRKFYDGLGRKIQTQTAGATLASGTRDIVTDFEYNGNGQVVKQTVPYEIAQGSSFHPQELEGLPDDPELTETSYDLLGRVIEVKATDGTSTNTSYGLRYSVELDGWYFATKVRNVAAQYTLTLSDAWGRSTKVTAGRIEGEAPTEVEIPLQWVQYTYDSSDQLTTVTESGITPTVQLTYDLAGRKTQMADPDMGSWTYTYDALGNLTTQTDARTCTISMNYDGLNRLTGKTYTGPGACDPTVDVSYTYDNGRYGARTGMTDGSGSTTWQYDARGRMSQETKTVTGSGTFVTSWGYNSADLLDWMKYPANASEGVGEWVKYNYHPQLSTKSVCTWNGTACTFNYSPGIQYDEAGRVTLRKLGGNEAVPVLQTGYTYFDWTTESGQGRLQQIQTGTTGYPTSLQNLEYDYDLVGNVEWIKDWKAGSPQQQSFTYDSLNRLITAQALGGTYGDYAQEGYTYATDSGLLSVKGANSHTYPAQVSGCAAGSRSLPHAVSQAGTTLYSYDCNGNQTVRDPSGSDIHHLTYDGENRLVKVYATDPNNPLATFIYDGDGRRVKGTVGSITTTYIGNYFEWITSTSTMKQYYDAGGVRVAMRTDSSALNWLLGDHLGSTAITTDADGNLPVGELRYKAWGEWRASGYLEGDTPTSFRFTGQRQEAGIELYFYNARWYDSSLGRFTQADTMVPQPGNVLAWDRYAYTLNNPVRYTDPSGHVSCSGYQDCHPVGKRPPIMLKGFNRNELEKYDQNQIEDNRLSGCGPYALASSINLRKGDPNYLKGSTYEDALIRKWKKLENIGMPPFSQVAPLEEELPGDTIQYTHNGNENDLIRNVYIGNISVVTVSWEDNSSILKKFANQILKGGDGPSVGHVLVLVGYDSVENRFMFLDPGREVIKEYKYSDFMQIWKGQPNLFIPSGSLVTIYPQ